MEQASDGEEDGEGEVTDNIDREGFYGDDAEVQEPEVLSQAPGSSKKGPAMKGVTSKSSKGTQKELDGVDSLIVDGSVFEMLFNVKLSSPHIILAEVIQFLHGFAHLHSCFVQI